jgi:hypothetical protein
MPSVLSTNLLRSSLASAFCFACLLSSAQINSPYSRYGLGDINMSGNALNKGMGGLTTAYTDLQSVNFLNPASYSNIKWVTFDVGTEIESRTMRTPSSQTDKYNSGNFAFNYVTLGLPLSKQHNWGFVLGLRPTTRVNYKIETRERMNAQQTLKDSIYTLYEGNGGTYKAFIGSGIKFGGFSIGANFGYHFGQQQISTRRIFIADSTYMQYQKSNSANNTSLGSVFLEGGIQYQAKLKKDIYLQIGGTYYLQHNLKGSRDVVRETFEYDASGGNYRIDSVFVSNGQKGDVTYPASYSAGIILQKANKWLVGVQYDGASWSNYTSYGQKEQLANSYTYRLGTQLIPDFTSQSLLKRMSYRVGGYVGKDYINLGGNQLPMYAITLGAGIPVYHNNYALRNYLTTINLGLEFGRRGNDNTALKESFFRLHIGFSLSDISWFQKRKYD